MGPVPDVLVHHGIVVLFAWAFAVQAGMPAPAVPLLLGAGALSGAGQMDLALAVAAAVTAAIGADVLWYLLGRSYGTRVLEVLCRFSLDPDSLIRHAKERFAAHQVRYLVIAKFLPGVNPLAAGLAGAVPIRADRFAAAASAGAVLWAGAWIGLGYLFAGAIGLVLATAARAGRPLAIAAGIGLLGYLAIKFVRRRRFLRHLRRARITAEELRRRLDAGEAVSVFDLRTAVDVEAAPYGIPGARWVPPERLDDPEQLIARSREVIFYCAEPREATSARMALILDTHGYTQVHPLSGGLEGWRRAGFPVAPLRAELGRRSAAPAQGDGTAAGASGWPGGRET